MNRKTVFIFSTIALLVVFFAGAVFYNEQQEKAANQLAEANRAILVRAHAPSLGSADAPVVIVEFIDPACETCRTFYPLVKGLMAANPGKIRLVLRYAPFHEGSDKVVAILEAARRQSKFWETLEVLLERQSAWTQNHKVIVDRVWPLLDGVGLNMERMAFDITSPSIAKIIEQDLADAATLKVNQTPEFFVNGKPLPSFGFDQLKTLVRKALAETQSR